MQTCILALGILLAGQLSDSSGTRYSVLPPGTTANGGAMELSQPQSPEHHGHQHGHSHHEQQHPYQRAEQPVVTQPEEQPLRMATPPRAVVPPVTTATPPQLTKVTPSSDLLRSLAKPVGRDKLSGMSLSLSEAVNNARSRAEQTRRVKLYWELSQAVTDFHLASLEELELTSLYNGLGQAGQAWGTAQQAVATRKQVTHSSVVVAQWRLQKALGRASDTRLLLPSDLPHCGAYKTKYEEIFQRRTSPEAQQLGGLLALRHQQLGQLASDAAAAREWLILVRQQQSPQNDSTQLLKAYEQLALQRQTFVATAYQYNANIARYTELAVPQKVGNVRLVSMLIQSSGNTESNRQPGAVRQATAEEELPSKNNAQHYNAQHYNPQTYAEPERNETRRVPANTGKGERSIVVAP